MNANSGPSADDIRLQFAQLAMQYYIAGRAAAIQQLIPVLGNLLHHAVELSVKAGLAGNLSIGQLKSIGHNLPRLWAEFVALHPEIAAPRFQAAVDALHKFEELRYPDSVLARGASMQLALHRAHVVTPNVSPSGVPTYLLILEDVDELEKAIFASANLNPKFFTASLSPSARDHLLLHNLHGTDW